MTLMLVNFRFDDSPWKDKYLNHKLTAGLENLPLDSVSAIR